MTHSDEGYKIACEHLLPRILDVLNELKPGSRQGIVDSAVQAMSVELEQAETPSLKDALFTVAGMESGATPPSKEIHDEARIEGEANGRLGFAVATELLFMLDRANPQLGLVPKILNGITVALRTQKRDKGSNPVLEEMLRIIDASHVVAGEEWKKRKTDDEG